MRKISKALFMSLALGSAVFMVASCSNRDSSYDDVTSDTTTASDETTSSFETTTVKPEETTTEPVVTTTEPTETTTVEPTETTTVEPTETTTVEPTETTTDLNQESMDFSDSYLIYTAKDGTSYPIGYFRGFGELLEYTLDEEGILHVTFEKGTFDIEGFMNEDYLEKNLSNILLDGAYHILEGNKEIYDLVKDNCVIYEHKGEYKVPVMGDEVVEDLDVDSYYTVCICVLVDYVKEVLIDSLPSVYAKMYNVDANTAATILTDELLDEYFGSWDEEKFENGRDAITSYFTCVSDMKSTFEETYEQLISIFLPKIKEANDLLETYGHYFKNYDGYEMQLDEDSALLVKKLQKEIDEFSIDDLSAEEIAPIISDLMYLDTKTLKVNSSVKSWAETLVSSYKRYVIYIENTKETSVTFTEEEFNSYMKENPMTFETVSDVENLERPYYVLTAEKNYEMLREMVSSYGEDYLDAVDDLYEACKARIDAKEYLNETSCDFSMEISVFKNFTRFMKEEISNKDHFEAFLKENCLSLAFIYEEDCMDSIQGLLDYNDDYDYSSTLVLTWEIYEYYYDVILKSIYGDYVFTLEDQDNVFYVYDEANDVYARFNSEEENEFVYNMPEFECTEADDLYEIKDGKAVLVKQGLKSKLDGKTTINVPQGEDTDAYQYIQIAIDGGTHYFTLCQSNSVTNEDGSTTITYAYGYVSSSRSDYWDALATYEDGVLNIVEFGTKFQTSVNYSFDEDSSYTEAEISYYYILEDMGDYYQRYSKSGDTYQKYYTISKEQLGSATGGFYFLCENDGSSIKVTEASSSMKAYLELQSYKDKIFTAEEELSECAAGVNGVTLYFMMEDDEETSAIEYKCTGVYAYSSVTLLSADLTNLTLSEEKVENVEDTLYEKYSLLEPSCPYENIHMKIYVPDEKGYFAVFHASGDYYYFETITHEVPSSGCHATIDFTTNTVIFTDGMHDESDVLHDEYAKTFAMDDMGDVAVATGNSNYPYAIYSYDDGAYSLNYFNSTYDEKYVSLGEIKEDALSITVKSDRLFLSETFHLADGITISGTDYSAQLYYKDSYYTLSYDEDSDSYSVSSTTAVSKDSSSMVYESDSNNALSVKLYAKTYVLATEFDAEDEDVIPFLKRAESDGYFVSFIYNENTYYVTYDSVTDMLKAEEDTDLENYMGDFSLTDDYKLEVSCFDGGYIAYLLQDVTIPSECTYTGYFEFFGKYVTVKNGVYDSSCDILDASGKCHLDYTYDEDSKTFNLTHVEQNGWCYLSDVSKMKISDPDGILPESGKVYIITTCEGETKNTYTYEIFSKTFTYYNNYGFASSCAYYGAEYANTYDAEITHEGSTCLVTVKGRNAKSCFTEKAEDISVGDLVDVFFAKSDTREFVYKKLVLDHDATITIATTGARYSYVHVVTSNPQHVAEIYAQQSTEASKTISLSAGTYYITCAMGCSPLRNDTTYTLSITEVTE